MTYLIKLLPDDIIGHIFEFDNTYQEIFTKTVLRDIHKQSWKRWIKKFTHYGSNVEFALNHFVEDYDKWFKERLLDDKLLYINHRLFPDEVMIKVTNFYRFTNIRFVEKEGDYNSFLTYRIFSTEQYKLDIETDDKRFTQIDSNKLFILFEYS